MTISSTRTFYYDNIQHQADLGQSETYREATVFEQHLTALLLMVIKRVS